MISLAALKEHIFVMPRIAFKEFMAPESMALALSGLGQPAPGWARLS